ncbi:hypothetical protein VTI28DRAFT_7152 [Corynascus sepedonium]
MCIKHIDNIIGQLSRHQLEDAFAAILVIGDGLHAVVSPSRAVADLHQMAQLFSSIASHDAYEALSTDKWVVHLDEAGEGG